MENGAGHQQQLSEIHEMITEARSRFTGGGVVAVVWGLLSAAALTIGGLGLIRNAWILWATHNVLGWAFTLLWFRHETRSEGRVSLRGRYVLRLWAAITLAVWVTLGALSSRGADIELGLTALLPVLLGIGILATGLLSESMFSQCVGTALLVAGPALTVFAPRSVAPALAIAAIALVALLWGVGSWLVKEKA